MSNIIIVGTKKTITLVSLFRSPDSKALKYILARLISTHEQLLPLALNSQSFPIMNRIPITTNKQSKTVEIVSSCLVTAKHQRELFPKPVNSDSHEIEYIISGGNQLNCLVSMHSDLLFVFARI